jgi:glycerate-2-kinase
LSLIVSDVIGNPLDVIASGPTAPDRTTFGEAVDVLSRHGLVDAAPASVVAHLRAGGEETPKWLPDRVRNRIVGDNIDAHCAAQAMASHLGYPAIDLDSIPCVLEGDTTEVAVVVASLIRDLADHPTKRCCIVSTGETTVNLGGATGKGGRNQEFALAVLNKLGPDGLAGVCVLCGGTDGEDGPTDAAGAFVDEELARAAIARGLDPADFLKRHDAYHFFDALGGLVKTGPTHTNVMDLRVVLIDRAVGAAVPALAEPKARSASKRARP